MREAIDRIVASLSGHPPNTGLVVGVIRADMSSVFGYGKATDAGAEPPRGDTVFYVGSITKVFTTTLLSILVADGLVNWEDPVRDLVPGLSNLPPQITLLRLATHTSGLPKNPALGARQMFASRGNPFAAYTTQDVLQYLSQFHAGQVRPSIDQANYSNLGAGLLGYALAQEMGASYEQAVVSRICDKLGLVDTGITLTPEQEERLATPHKADGSPAERWDVPEALAGAGALVSTANDLLQFLAANFAPSRSPLSDRLQVCHEIHAAALPPQGRAQRLARRLSRVEQDLSRCYQSMALGWFVGRLQSGANHVFWHHGATGGYRGFVGFVKDTSTGVVVLANREPGKRDLLLNTTDADDIGFAALEHLHSSAS
jgi:D-alanyl-D-alanine-carboxypeptidase/D-alanyl-D-alanine-endopeptidase